MPGVPVALVDPLTGELADEGEIVLDLSQHPVNLMTGYLGDDERQAEAMAGGYYHTGDVAQRDADGYITYIGRTDDVFKASDYKVSPFELESVLIEHPAVAEAAVVPAPDPTRLAVPKAYIALAPGWEPDAETAKAILGHAREPPRALPAGAAAWSSSSCPRPSRARSAGWSCATASSRRSTGGTLAVRGVPRRPVPRPQGLTQSCDAGATAGAGA